MLHNVFEKTKQVSGEKMLSQKYTPSCVAECCISIEEIANIKMNLLEKRYFSIQSLSGNGATSCVRLIAKELQMYVHTLSCTAGCAEILKIFKQNMKNVLLALQCNTDQVLFLIKDIEGLNKTEKASILSAVEEIANIHAVCFYNNPIPGSKWYTYIFPEMSYYDKMVQLCRIVAEEEIDLEFDKIQELGGYKDFRNAINCLRCPEAHERDYADIENFSRILFTHETLNNKNGGMEELVVFSDLMVAIDLSEFRATREWFIQTLSDYSERQFNYGHKHSFVARHAQSCHRTVCLTRACACSNINILDMLEYSKLYRHYLLKGQSPLTRKMPDYDRKAKSLYTIAKIKATASQCKQLKKVLGI
jgi:hypothetical protein